MNVLITGATGYLGSELLRTLLGDSKVSRVHLFVRSFGDDSASNRIDRLCRHWQKFDLPFDQTTIQKVRIHQVDLTKSIDVPPMNLDVVYHCAASTDLSASVQDARRDNVYTTQRLVSWCQKANVKKFVHFSTAYVHGRCKGVVTTDQVPSSFHNHYERSKWESEQAVTHSGIPHVILRPSIVVGRSDNGYVMRLKVLYSVWRMWLANVIPRAPLDGRSRVDIVPVDYVVNSAIKLAQDARAVGQKLFLCAGFDSVSPFTIMDQAVRAFSVKRPPVSPTWVAYLLGSWPVRKFIDRSMLELLRTMYHHLPYLGIRGRVFDDSQTRELLETHQYSCPTFDHYGFQLFKFCADTHWGKRQPKKMQLIKGAA